MNELNMTPKDLMEALVRTADAKKAHDIVALRVTDRTTLADYFLMMTGTSTTHIRALSDEIEHKLKEQGVAPHHVEGVTSSWILMDYGSVVANIFLSDAREMYALERLWGDADPIDLSNIVIKED
jgi:iojap-like ribosome-associated protein